MSQGDTGGASSSAGTNQRDMSKENAKETGQQINKGVSQDNSRKASGRWIEQGTAKSSGSPPVIQLRKESGGNGNTEKRLD